MQVYRYYWYTGILLYWYIQVYRYTGIRVDRYTGKQVYRYTGILVYRYTWWYSSGILVTYSCRIYADINVH